MFDNVSPAITERKTLTGMYYGCSKVACLPATKKIMVESMEVFVADN